MKIKKVIKILSLLVFVIVMVIIIWQPVFPSKYILKGMAEQIDVQNITQDLPVVIRFYLTGKGGGIYNIVVDSSGAGVVEDDTDRIDLVLKAEAREFNSLIFSLARGKVNETAFINMLIAKRLFYAGDMNILKDLFKREEKDLK